jgi:hypothetical protein
MAFVIYKGKVATPPIAGGGGGTGVGGSILPGNFITATSVGYDFSSEDYGGAGFTTCHQLLTFIKTTLEAKNWTTLENPLVTTTVTLGVGATALGNTNLVTVDKVYSGSTTYIVATDYNVSLAPGTIARITTGGITAGGSVSVDYVKNGGSLLMEGKTANNHSCFVEFKVERPSNVGRLTLRAWAEAAKTNGSPDNLHDFEFNYLASNRIWLICRKDAGAIAIYNSLLTTGNTGYHFGFLNRIDQDDQDAWMIGRIHTRYINQAYIRAPKADPSVYWRQLSSVFTGQTTNPIPGTQQNFPMSTFDPVASVQSTNFNSTTNTNYGYNCHLGRTNYDGKYLLAPGYYIEGENATTDYGNATFTPYYRGSIPFVFYGGGKAGYCEQLEDTNGNRYLSVEANGGQLICFTVN